MSAVTETKGDRQSNPVAVLRQQLSGMQGEFRAALPAHMPVERFTRVAMTAVQNNAELLECDRRSFFNACMRAAQDGLLPDGRDGAIVVRRDSQSSTGKSAHWQVMVGGIRKKARNSGEIATWDVVDVYANDHFEFELGDQPFIRHRPALTNRGNLIAVYSICTLKSGEKTRDIMAIEDVYAIRDKYSDGWKAFRAGKIKSTPWSTAPGEMAKKTIARRHSKTIPMSSDLDDLIRRDDEIYNTEGSTAVALGSGASKRLSLAGKLDALVSGPAAVAESDAPHDPDTGEIIQEGQPAAPQPSGGVPGSTSRTEAGEASPVASPAEEIVVEASEDEMAAEAVPAQPRTSAEYRAHAMAYIQAATAATALAATWRSIEERRLRQAVNIDTDTFAELSQCVGDRLEELKRAAS